jgi:hypothetical protein
VNEVNKRDPAAFSGIVTIEDYANKKPVSTYRQNGSNYKSGIDLLSHVEFVNEVNKRDPAAFSGIVTIEDYANKKPVSTYRQNGF